MKRQHLLEFFSHNAIKNKIEIYCYEQIHLNTDHRSLFTVHRSQITHTRGGARNPPRLKIQTT